MESKEDFIREVRELLNANEKVVHVELNQIVDMVHELAESYGFAGIFYRSAFEY